MALKTGVSAYSLEGYGLERFIAMVERAELGREPARRATQATLETLAERISKGEALLAPA